MPKQFIIPTVINPLIPGIVFVQHNDKDVPITYLVHFLGGTGSLYKLDSSLENKCEIINYSQYDKIRSERVKLKG